MRILVLDSQTFEWLRPHDAYIVKTGWADGEFTPVKFVSKAV